MLSVCADTIAEKKQKDYRKMKKLIMGLQDNRQVFVFAVLGLLLILFPKEIGTAAPYILGILMVLYGCLNIILSLKYDDDASLSLGDGVVHIVIGGVLLFQKGDSIVLIGLVWAMISLYEAAREIDEFRKERKFTPVQIIRMIGMIISIALAVLLMINPFAHFYTHVRILGLEIIAASLVRGAKDWKTRKGK